MKFPVLISLLVLFAGCARAAEETAPPPAKPGLLNRLLHPFGGGKAPKGKGLNFKSLEMGMTINPSEVKLSEVNQMKVTLTVVNKGKKLAQLEFPTTQRIEVLLKSKTGKLVEQWSEDQAFTNEPTIVTINPGERLEYSANISTRDMAAGEPFTIEAFFPNFEQLRKVRGITPEK